MACWHVSQTLTGLLPLPFWSLSLSLFGAHQGRRCKSSVHFQRPILCVCCFLGVRWSVGAGQASMWNPDPSQFPQDSAGGSLDFIHAPHTSVWGVTEVHDVKHKLFLHRCCAIPPQLRPFSMAPLFFYTTALSCPSALPAHSFNTGVNSALILPYSSLVCTIFTVKRQWGLSLIP